MTTDTWHKGAPADNWDKEQQNLSAHFLQSFAWARFQETLGHAVYHAAGKNWSWVAIYESNKLGSRLYVPYGPTAKSASSLEKALEALVACGQELDVDFVRIEPNIPDAPMQTKKVLKKTRAKRAHRDIQPKHTFVKDLTRPDDELYGEMASTNRRLTRRSSEAGFIFKATNAPQRISVFLDMIHQVAKRTGMQPHSDAYFKAMVDVLFPLGAATLHIAEHNGKAVSSCIVFETADVRYYAHAANAEFARKLQPSVYMMGHLIFDAKKDGKKLFDYFGVAPPNAPKTHKWGGFTQFKKSFGGHYIEYSGTWEIPLKPTRYQAYRLVTHLRDAGAKSRKFARRTVKNITKR